MPAMAVRTGQNSERVNSVGNKSRIVGNNPAEPHTYPWMVALLYDNKVYCGGSIIDANHILAYKSCLVVPPAKCVVYSDSVTLLIGGHNINASNEDEPGRIILNVTRQYIFAHPKWGVVPVSHDIAIIRLPAKLTFSNNIRPICLQQWTRLAETFENQVMVDLYFRFVQAVGNKFYLKSHTVRLCDGMGPLHNPDKWVFTGNNMCAKPAPKQSPCRCDVGGPLMIREGVDPHYTLVGIVSSSVNPFCEDGNPVVFTRITAVLDFIYEITGRNV
ncbi:chymotrypsin B [Folsomia candida]|uniref:chymotrypsin B n=1 Tax=Folsomia candida TaxID=158441 RepID=UPI0016054087|nr:chymotrypsin B [Folsomia candida]